MLTYQDAFVSSPQELRPHLSFVDLVGARFRSTFANLQPIEDAEEMSSGSAKGWWGLLPERVVPVQHEGWSLRP
jgi:hypothetical protein